jgi:hypothetical protein
MAEYELEEELRNAWQRLVETRDEPESPLSLPPEQRMALSPPALFAELEEVREAWHELRGRVNEDLSKRYINASWTLKELLAHLASWAKEFRMEVETVSRGESFDYSIPFAMTVFGPNQWNEEQVRSRAASSLSEIFDELEGETERLEEVLLTLTHEALYGSASFPFAPTGEPAERWRGTNAFIIAGKCLHDRHHIAQIRDRLDAWQAVK